MILFELLVVLVGPTSDHSTHVNLLFVQSVVSSFVIAHLHNGVKCIDISKGRVYISRDVVFDENVFPFVALRPNVGPLLRKEILLLPSMSSILHEDVSQANDHMTTFVPITDALQAGGNTSENLRQNSEETTQNEPSSNSGEKDKSGARSHSDPPRTSSVVQADPEVDRPAAPAAPEASLSTPVSSRAR
jgi:hypothetical protein